MLFFNKKSELLQEAEQEFIQMLDTGYKMYSLTLAPLAGAETNKATQDLKTMDKEINKLHRDVRKKLFEHLSFSGCKDLFPSLVLLSVIDDSERIGDYIQNIADTISVAPKIDFFDFKTDIEELLKKTDSAFTQTSTAFVDQNEQMAEAIVQDYKAIAVACDSILNKMLSLDKNKVKKDYIALALLVRYLKRSNAHLKNIASGVVNPYHRIGYKVKK